MDGFANEFVLNLHILAPVIIAIVIGMPVFGIFFNRFIDNLEDGEHTSLYVAIGVSITLLAGAVISWKASLLFLFLFGLDGLPMIAGDFKRTLKKAKESKYRRKRLPYAANAIIDEAHMSAREAHRLLDLAFKNTDRATRTYQMANASHEINTIMNKLIELKLIQKIDE